MMVVIYFNVKINLILLEWNMLLKSKGLAITIYTIGVWTNFKAWKNKKQGNFVAKQK